MSPSARRGPGRASATSTASISTRSRVVDRDRVLARLDERRNSLVHEYGRVNDEIVFETVRGRLEDFDTFKREVLAFLKK